MKIASKVFASIVTLLAACLVHAADMKPVNRVISITDIETDDATGYASWITKRNDVVKAKLGIDSYQHVYVSNNDGTKTGSVRVVTAAESVSSLVKNNAALAGDPALTDIGNRLRAVSKNGARVLYQGVRFDGTYPGAYVYTTLLMATDEAGYLKSLDGLRALFDAKGFKDAKINAYRVLAGRTNFSHRVTIALPSNERLAAMLDFLASDAQMAAWLADTAKYRTVLSNGTARGLSK